MKVPLPIQIAGIVVCCLVLAQVLTQVGLGGLLPVLVVVAWVAVVAGLLHAQRWPGLTMIGNVVDQAPTLRAALDRLVGGNAARRVASARSAAAIPPAPQSPPKPPLIDPTALGPAIREGIAGSLLGQEVAAAELAAIVARALDPSAQAAAPRLVLVAGGPGSGRTTLLDIVGRAAQAAGASTLLLRLGDTADTGSLGSAAAVLVDDMDQQSPAVREAVSALLRRKEATRLIVLAFRDNLPVAEPDRQPVPDSDQVNRLLAPLGGIEHSSVAAVIVPAVPDGRSMIRAATKLLERRSAEHSMRFDSQGSQEAIALAIFLPFRSGGLAVHPGLWMKQLDALCDRELSRLAREGVQHVRLTMSPNRGGVFFEGIS